MQLAAERVFKAAMWTPAVTGTASVPVATAAFRSSRLRPDCRSASCTTMRASVSADSPVCSEAPPRILSPSRITALVDCDPRSIPTTAISVLPSVAAGLTGPAFQHLHERLGADLHLRPARMAILEVELQDRDSALLHLFL